MSLSVQIQPLIAPFLMTREEHENTRFLSPLGIPTIAGWYIPTTVFDRVKDHGHLSVLGCRTMDGSKVVVKAI